MNDKKTKALTFTIEGYESKQLDNLIEEHVMTSLYGGGDYDSGAPSFEDRLMQVIREHVDRALGDMLKARLHDMVEKAIADALKDGIEVTDGYRSTKTVTLDDHIRELFTGKHFVQSDQLRRGDRENKVTLVEFIALKSATGQIEAEAAKLVAEMRKSLQDQIASNLSSQLAGRMLKGCHDRSPARLPDRLFVRFGQVAS